MNDLWTRAVALTAKYPLTRFLLVGGLGLLVNSLTLLALHQWLSLPLLVALPLATELAIVSNFLLNDRWTFLGRARSRSAVARFARFNAVSLFGMLVTMAATMVLVGEVGLQYLVANLCGIGLATSCNFFVNLRWTWGEALSAC